MALIAKITPVGVDKDNPTRYDLSVEGVNGSVCGWTTDKIEAESWKEGLQLALNAASKIQPSIKKEHDEPTNY